jgi:hypothetical protein
MLYKAKVGFRSDTNTKHINTLCGQNVEFVNVKHGGTFSPYRAVNTLSLGYTNQSVNAVQ